MSNQRENVEHESVHQEAQDTSTSAAEAPAAEGGEDIQARLAELEELAEQRRDQLLRAQAEMENQRRRFERELEAAHKYAMERFASELLTVCDSLEMGLDAARKTEDAGSIIEGTELTLKALRKAFDKFGIESVDPTGERFDPERHQAMTTQESAEHRPNTVLMTMQKGYLLQGRVLRPAMVIVSRAPDESSGSA
ncbi:nucleotide exchange factor GrpE [Thioalkalivibrio paradoxus]|uniref:Protein GrpE n=1 Tax=Thioalkalivibrio paradoxus ARh 1 TaxID=713585 RepID=W0DKB6_9GAMM|nr:nucleotide exchange factor GrpE [Thioalkalivibrio paradoxus]AHE99044.1 molecular chaperone GrpE [Thioalkalivibrio paradoxus ARh 1]